jgi:hypothetical protein
VRAVADLVLSALEASGERDLGIVLDLPAEERLGSFACAALHDRGVVGHEPLECVVRHDNYSCRMTNSELLLRDLLARLAEHLGVLQRNVREQDDLGVDDVRRVEPPPKPRFDDCDVHPLLGELEERSGGENLELCRPELLRGTANPRDGPLEAGLVTIQPLVPAGDVRRGVRAHAQPFAAKQLGDHAGGGRLPVRADDVNRGVGVLWIAEAGEERPHPVEAELLGPWAERGDPCCRARRASC